MPWHARLHRCCKPSSFRNHQASRVHLPPKPCQRADEILNIIYFSYFLRNYKILKMEACSSMLHWFTAVSGLRERLLVDNLFLAKLVVECVVEPSAMSVLF
ncbi:hypothetical protein VPH35_069865 [Triticum aestivum]